MNKRNILCIDLKSFFASVECVKRNLDPFKINLVVANPNQGKGAITLAVTPHLKSLGVKSRGRLYEIPNNIQYIIASPHMSTYIEYSKKVVNIYLDFVAEEDLHVYSIDECFLDLTNYLSSINTNTLILWGEKDTDTPLKDGKLMHKKITNSELIIFPNCTHYCYLENTYVIIKIILCFLED